MHGPHDPNAPPAPVIGFDKFLAVDIRIGASVAAEPFPEARKPACKLRIDFGLEVGVRQSSAQDHAPLRRRRPGRPTGRGGGELPPRQIGKFMSVVLTLGFPDENGEVVLFSPDRKIPNGARLF